RGVLGAPRLRSDTPRRIRRRCAGPGSNGELGQTATGMVPRPSGDDHDLVEDPPLVLLPRRGIEVEVIVDDQLRIRIRVDLINVSIVLIAHKRLCSSEFWVATSLFSNHAEIICTMVF